MSAPGIVQSTLGDEQIAASVSLGGEDELYVTPTRTLIYRSEGLLSDESVDEFPHDAERITVTEGRRKTKLVLEYGIDGERSFAVPAKRVDDVLHPVLAGVLNAAGVTDPGETVKQTYRFSELTLIVTSARLVKHIGEAVWDQDYEEFHFEDVTGLEFEEGSVATQLVLEIDGRAERIKAPNEQAPAVRERLERALFAYHDVTNAADFERAVRPDEDDEEDDADADADPDENISFGGGVDPLEANPPATGQDGGDADSGGSEAATADASGTERAAESTETGSATAAAEPADGDRPDLSAVDAALDDAGFQSVEEDHTDEVTERLDDLAAAVERQNELLTEHHRTLELLIEELKRGR